MARVIIAAVIITLISAQKASFAAMFCCAAWAAWAPAHAAPRAGTEEALPQPTKTEGQAHEGDVDGVERGVAAHAFAAAHAPRQRKAN